MSYLSETDLCNLALDRLGQQPISSMTQTTGNGPLVSRNYYHERNALLGETHWTFARSELTLALVGTMQWVNWSYAYQYPPDCLKIHYICNPNLISNYIGYPYNPPIDDWYQRNSPHEVTQAMDSNNNPTGQKVILSNMQNAILVYTKNTIDTALFPETFVSVLVLRLAIAICYRLQPMSPMLQSLKSELMLADSTAKRDASNESVEKAERHSDFERSRL